MGIIANPASGKDIRRLVAHGSVFNNKEKARIVRRVLLGLEAVGVNQICYMPDYYGIVEEALSQVDISSEAFPLTISMRGDQNDSIEAAQMMELQGAACIIALGGDGTHRAVAKGSVAVPTLPISTGTNNVFSSMVEGTVAGMAAGIVANRLVPLEECTFPCTKLEVALDGIASDIALVDVVASDDQFVGSRALWNMEKVRKVFLNCAAPYSIGISSIGGQLYPISLQEPRGLSLDMSESGRAVMAAIAPGMVSQVFVKEVRIMDIDDDVDISLSPCILALDGEREIQVPKGQRASVRLKRNGPLVVDVKRTMVAARNKKIFVTE